MEKLAPLVSGDQHRSPQNSKRVENYSISVVFTPQKQVCTDPDKIWHVGVHRGSTRACQIWALISDIGVGIGATSF